MKKIILVLVVVFLFGVVFFVLNKKPQFVVIPDQDNGSQQKIDLIVLDNPKGNDQIKSPLTLSGKARGYWYFEASFPIEIQDRAGTVLGQGIAQAQGEWMTEEFVPFIASVSFSPPSTKTGFIVLKKDNPSGDPARDDSLRVPVSFLP